MGVQLNEAELAEFLENEHILILATIRKSCEPFLTPLWYTHYEQFFMSRHALNRGSCGTLEEIQEFAACWRKARNGSI